MKPNRNRMIILLLAILLIFGALYARNGYVSVALHEQDVARLQDKTSKTIRLTGNRGTIYDANMVPLAFDEKSYDVQFYRDPSKSSQADRANYTQVILKTIQLVESNGKETISEFWLSRDENGQWQFDTGTTNPAVAAKREEQWRGNFYESKTPVEQLFDTLCQKYAVPADLDEEMKIKILAVWQASRMNAFNTSPVTIASDVGFETVSEIEVMSMDLDGITIAESTTRRYPHKTLASHVIGYTAKLNSNNRETYIAMGYPNDAEVGATGIEYSMEAQLSPNVEYRRGSRVMEVSTQGKAIREISYTEPTDGNSVVLTIESSLQQVAENSLAKTIESIRDYQENTLMPSEGWQRRNADTLAEYAEKGTEIQLADSGAVVAMDPNTGRVLALASYPGYDLSMFEGGSIDNGSWSIIATDSRNPMFNRAVSAKDSPGSIFKLCTSLAGLAEHAITVDERISDEGYFTKTDQAHPSKCWINLSKIGEHANQTVVEAIKNSCNYFFYTVGYRLGSANLTKWAAALGLTSKTNIELPSESTSIVGNQDMLYDSSRAISDQYTAKPLIAANKIRSRLFEIGEARGITYDEERVEAATKALLDLVTTEGDKTSWYPLIKQILLYDMNIPETYISSHFLVNEVVSYLNDLRWTANETIMAAIGQSITQITPIAAARYVAAIANGGTVYDAQIVSKVLDAQGNVILEKEPVVANRISTEEIYFDKIREGMNDVASPEEGGTASSYFKNWKYKDVLCVKTGTSQRTELDVENNSWMVAFAPIDDPKIVVVSYIQNGYAGSQSSPIIKDIIEYYLDSLEYSESTTTTTENSLAD